MGPPEGDGAGVGVLWGDLYANIVLVQDFRNVATPLPNDVSVLLLGHLYTDSLAFALLKQYKC